MTDETYMFFKVFSRDFYEQVTKSLDASRGFPNGKTQQSLRNWEDLEVDGEGVRYLLVDRWRITPPDEAFITAAIDINACAVITMSEYIDSLTPPQEPVE